MTNLSEDYYLREYYFQREQVPTLSVMTKKMTPPLAAVYFKSMRPRLKVLAGLEPSLRGGGSDWYVPPEDLLNGRAVLKPVRKEIMSKLNHQGVANIGIAVFQRHRKAMDLEIKQRLVDSDIKWKNAVTATSQEVWDDLVAAATKKNTKRITHAFDEFAYLYRQSIGKIEILFHESAIAEIKNARQYAIQDMQTKYAAALKYQASLNYDEYEIKLSEEKTRLKIDFMKKLEISRTTMADRIHDLKVDKHIAIEKLRQCLHCQNLACGVYVALKEQDKCLEETEELKHVYKQRFKMLTETILVNELEIHLADDKEKKQREFCNIWRKKVCHVVKTFQKFVSYCLNILPEHAEFFINMEKLMLLQVDEALADPSAASIIEPEKEQFHTPIPRPKPFYLFCDRGYKHEPKQDLCPRHSGTSSASGIPVMIINKRCLYAACDNFEQFTNKIKEFIHGNRGDDADLKDDLVYEHFVPVKYGSSQQLLDVKLESSLLQIVQQEMAYIETDKKIVPIKCNSCGLTWCSCPLRPSSYCGENTKLVSSNASSRHKLKSMSRSMKFDLEREPKWESFCKHIQPKKCNCAQMAKKHLAENMPVYMRHMKYGPPEIPGYKICSTNELKTLVREARKEILPPPVPVAVPSRTNDMSTQCYDLEFETLCTCLSNPEEVNFPFDPTMPDDNSSLTDAGNGILSSQLTKRMSSFATSRAQSLRNLLKESPDIKELFTREHCTFE